MNINNKPKFNDVGFLSDESSTNHIALEVITSEHFTVCNNLNVLAHSALNKAVVHPDDRKEVYVMLYFQRMLSHYQALIIMAERGMVHQVEIMLRCMLETLFNLVALHENADLFDALILGDDDQRLILLKRIREQQKTTATYTHDELKTLDKIIASAEDVDRENFKIYMKADMAGMLNDYRTTYPLLSEAVHSTVHSIETDLIFDDNDDEIISINSFTQKTGEMSLLLMTSANYITIGIEMLFTVFPNAENETDLLQLKDNVQNLWQNVVVAVQHR
ncbi:MAG: hypothetical protein HRT93_07785 [Piscirickettsiaceae bacterium]|nr:hypothetical protein [Piscirickettsiaceae bacterium]